MMIGSIRPLKNAASNARLNIYTQPFEKTLSKILRIKPRKSTKIQGYHFDFQGGISSSTHNENQKKIDFLQRLNPSGIQDTPAEITRNRTILNEQEKRDFSQRLSFSGIQDTTAPVSRLTRNRTIRNEQEKENFSQGLNFSGIQDSATPAPELRRNKTIRSEQKQIDFSQSLNPYGVQDSTATSSAPELRRNKTIRSEQKQIDFSQKLSTYEIQNTPATSSVPELTRSPTIRRDASEENMRSPSIESARNSSLPQSLYENAKSKFEQLKQKRLHLPSSHTIFSLLSSLKMT